MILTNQNWTLIKVLLPINLLEGGWEKGKEKEEEVDGAKSADPSMELRGLLNACVYAGLLWVKLSNWPLEVSSPLVGHAAGSEGAGSRGSEVVGANCSCGGYAWEKCQVRCVVTDKGFGG